MSGSGLRIERIEWDGAEPGALAAKLRGALPAPERIAGKVAELIADVREGGDAALLAQSERFDGVRPRALRLGRKALDAALIEIDPELRAALELAAANVRAVAEAQRPDRVEVELPQGHSLTLTDRPVASAGIYVPGGRAPYPSTALMGVIPARAAGVERIAVATPPGPDGVPDPAVLAACAIAGATEVHPIGGAGAIAALAYGAESVAPVEVIAGPGGPWVQEAKLQVSRRVGIDGYAGPSELVIVCDASVPTEWVALDLGAQAEHGADGLLVAASPDLGVLGGIEAAVRKVVAERDRTEGTGLALVAVPDLTAALSLAEQLAPEHLELAFEGSEAAAAGSDGDLSAAVAAATGTAGCAFVGAGGATAFGDYAAGSNHVLPTGGAGRFQGPLSPATFRKPTSMVSIGADAAVALAPAVESIAEAEGFPLHAESARVRASGPADQAS